LFSSFKAYGITLPNTPLFALQDPAINIMAYDGKPEDSVLINIRAACDAIKLLSVDELRAAGRALDARLRKKDDVALIMCVLPATTWTSDGSVKPLGQKIAGKVVFRSKSLTTAARWLRGAATVSCMATSFLILSTQRTLKVEGNEDHQITQARATPVYHTLSIVHHHAATCSYYQFGRSCWPNPSTLFYFGHTTQH
jgi:hypothetical protein